jgi:hypothetical protein
MSDSIWEQLFLPRDLRAIRGVRRAESAVSSLREEQQSTASTVAETHEEIVKIRALLERVVDTQRVLTTTVTALGEALSEAKVIDADAIKARIDAKLHPEREDADMVAEGRAPIVRTTDCGACGAKNRGDAKRCAECDTPLKKKSTRR